MSLHLTELHGQAPQLAEVNYKLNYLQLQALGQNLLLALK
jgi:hypothetical protein